MSRYNLAKIVLTIISLIMVRFSFVADDIPTLVDLIFLHMLAMLMIGFIEAMATRITEEANKDD